MRELNEEQRIAVSHFAGPMLVLAGPGSGKTYTITERIKRLVKEHDVAPGNILVITFTKAAAAEMKQRYLAEGGKGGVQFGTFHAVFFTILKYAYHYSADNIIRDEMKYRILRDLVAESRLEIQDKNEFLVDQSGEPVVSGGSDCGDQSCERRADRAGALLFADLSGGYISTDIYEISTLLREEAAY